MNAYLPNRRNQTVGASILDARIVILNNYLRPHHVHVYREIARRVGKLTILLSTAMESDRAWKPEWADLDVEVQKSWSWTARWKSKQGYESPNHIHFPLDAFGRLRRLKPDLVFSYEFGPRTLMCCNWRMMNRRSRLVVVGNMSQHVERERGRGRKVLRSLIRRLGDRFTYNGPGCREYMQELGIPDNKLNYFPYYFDEEKVFRGPREWSCDGIVRMVYAGVIEPRKGAVHLLEILRRWKRENPDRRLELTLCGSGNLSPAFQSLSGENVSINLPGELDSGQLCEVYRRSDLCVFPSLADEWGLVPVEAMVSGVAVLGSRLAQSVETLVKEGENGWSFWPADHEGFYQVFEQAIATAPEQIAQMGHAARKSVEHITATHAADAFCEIASQCMQELQSNQASRV